jgi:hypothetical protein
MSNLKVRFDAPHSMGRSKAENSGFLRANLAAIAAKDG